MSALSALRVESARPDAVRGHPWAGWLAVATVCFGAFMGQLDASIVTLTFPSLQHSFGASLAAVSWVSLGYLLVLVALLVAVGRWADAFGRKLVYLQGFVVFTLASAACGLAPSLGWLIGFRLVQAVGAAMLQANSVALVVTSVPPASMRRALGVQAAAQALGLAAGPTVGALLVASAGWRWVFLVNVPVGVVGVVAGRYLLPRTRDRRPAGRFDTTGLVLMAGASAALLLTLSACSGLAVPVLPAAAFAAALLVAFLVWIRRAAQPLLPPALLANRRLVGALCGYLVLFAPLTLVPQLYSGPAAGLTLTALPAGFALSALLGPRRRRGPARPEAPVTRPVAARGRRRVGAGDALPGLVCVAAALGLAAWHADQLVVAALLLVLGLGLGLFIPANNARIMASIPRASAGVGGGLVNMCRGLGTALGVASVTLCLHVSGPGLALLLVAGAALVGAAFG